MKSIISTSFELIKAFDTYLNFLNGRKINDHPFKKDKNDRLIWDGSFTPNWDAICINMMLSHESEPEIICASIARPDPTHIGNPCSPTG